jgi:hypothetical protein
MHRTARFVALALTLGASGCYTSVCIHKPYEVGEVASCAEEEHRLCELFACSDGEDEDAPAYEEYEPQVEESCDESKIGTTCKDEGFGYYCDDGYWYKAPC